MSLSIPYRPGEGLRISPDELLHAQGRLAREREHLVRHPVVASRAVQPNDEGRHPFGRNGEIDIAEAVGRTPSSVFATLHFNYEAGAGGRIGGSLDTRAALDQSFHVFAVEWDTGEVRWFLDDQLYFRAGKNTVMWPAPPGAALPAPFDQPFYLIMNLAVGGTWPGDPDDTTVFPAVMQVDYVRVFQRKG